MVHKLPEHLRLESHVAISPRKTSLSWLCPSIKKPKAGYICLTNSSNEIIFVKKANHLADIRDSQIVDLPPKTLLGEDIHEDTSILRFCLI